ncbi:MAG: coenzyme F420-0:L-glutamate ligase [Candidatus Colwellbacteria bacterium]|nr:coenzyme F420-0:L-glutamate ligase [Candidatus Colwellbacteria bacterium]
MKIKPIKTRVLVPPKDDLLEAISSSLKSLREKSVVVITSKVVSIWQGRCIPVEQCPNGDELIIQEADAYLPREKTPGAWVMQTLKNNLLIPSAGIDKSNANDHYILWPNNLNRVVKELYDWFRKKYRVKDLGIIISDSHTIPLRRGVLGISLAHYGFIPLQDYRGKPDLFGRPLKITQKNIADGLAAAAVLVMGEGAESTPLAVIQDVSWIKFTIKPRQPRKPFSSFEIRTSEDLYYPLISSAAWKQGGRGRKIHK